MVALYWVACQF